MAHIIIKNIGPIKEVKLDLNKINVFMGPQSSGKSTIAKIISFCLWIEKNVCLFRNILKVEMNFQEILEKYHHLQGYFKKPNPYIYYESEYVKIEYSNRFAKIQPLETINALTYKRSKIIYFPAERNLIALSYWDTLKFSPDNLRDYASDWGYARTLFTKDNYLVVRPLDVTYYYEEQSRENLIE